MLSKSLVCTCIAAYVRTRTYSLLYAYHVHYEAPSCMVSFASNNIASPSVLTCIHNISYMLMTSIAIVYLEYFKVTPPMFTLRYTIIYLTPCSM